MKKFIIKAGIIGLLPFIILFIGYFIVPVKQSHFKKMYEIKSNLLNETKEPRLIFVGGSNVLLGFNSKLIKDTFNLNVINYGLVAPIGLKFMVDDIISHVRKDDIIIFAPEWNQFYTQMYGTGEYLSIFIKISRWKDINKLNYNQIKTLISGIPKYMLHDIMSQKSNSPYEYNEYGDEINHWSIKKKYKSHPSPIIDKFDIKFGKYFINKLNELQSICTVIMIPPATCNVAMKKWGKQVKEVENYLKLNEHPFIIDPNRCSFGEDYMYDSDYHLNKKGVDLRTSLVIDALIKELYK